jgi:hypothetical protein
MVRRARVAAPIALAALSVVAALSLGRVVDSSRFVLPVIAAAVLPSAQAPSRLIKFETARVGEAE